MKNLVYIAGRGLALSALALAANSALAQDAAPSEHAQTTAKINIVKPESQRKVFMELYNRYDVSAMDQANSTGKVDSPNYIGVKYTLSPTTSVSLRQTALLKSQTASRPASSILDDTYINVASKKLLTWGISGSLDIIAARAYLPTGDKSRLVTGRNGRAMLWLGASGQLGIFDITYHQVHDVANYSKDLDTAGNPNQDYDLYQSIEIGKEVAKNFNLSLENGNEIYLFRNGTYESSYQFIINASLDIKPVNLALSIIDEISTVNPARGQFALMRQEEVMYKFILSAAL